MFYDKLERLCNKNKISPTAFMKAVGLSTSKLTAWKNGSSPSLKVAEQIVNYFDVDLNYFSESIPISERHEIKKKDLELENRDELNLLTLCRQLDERRKSELIGAIRVCFSKTADYSPATFWELSDCDIKIIRMFRQLTCQDKQYIEKYALDKNAEMLNQNEEAAATSPSNFFESL